MAFLFSLDLRYSEAFGTGTSLAVRRQAWWGGIVFDEVYSCRTREYGEGLPERLTRRVRELRSEAHVIYRARKRSWNQIALPFMGHVSVGNCCRKRP